MYRILKKTRVALSAVLGLVAIVAITTTAIGTAVHGGWITSLQIVPLIIADGATWVLAWFIVTFIFGRIYCSTVCPLGTMQDCISHAALKMRRHKRYHYSRPLWAVRWLFLAAMMLGLTGLSLTLTLTLDPYYSFNRIMTGVAIPAFTLGAFYVSLATAAAAAATFVVVLLLSATRGRLLCNTICPVGTALGLASISPVFRIDINTDRCTGCNRCVDVCKAACIDPWSHTVDTTRCVVCFNCTATCPNNAITYTCRRYRLRHPLLMQHRYNATVSRPSQRHT